MKHKVWNCLLASSMAVLCSATVAQSVDTEALIFKKAVKEQASKILTALGPAPLKLGKNQSIALQMVDKNPYAAMIFSSLYDDRSKTPLPEKGPMIFGFGDVALEPEPTKEFIRKYDNREKIDRSALVKQSDSTIFAEYDVRKTADGNGYLTIEMIKADKQGREIEKILPYIRVNLKRIGGKGDNGHWEPVGWQTY